jgi:hypothetical protein
LAFWRSHHPSSHCWDGTPFVLLLLHLAHAFGLIGLNIGGLCLSGMAHVCVVFLYTDLFG